MSTTYSHDEIRALLAAATPGPWSLPKSKHVRKSIVCDASGEFLADCECDGSGRIGDNEAALIAAAPTIIAQLLAEVEAPVNLLIQSHEAIENLELRKLLVEGYKIIDEHAHGYSVWLEAVEAAIGDEL